MSDEDGSAPTVAFCLVIASVASCAAWARSNGAWAEHSWMRSRRTWPRVLPRRSPITRVIRDVVWLEPRVTAEVSYTEMVNGWLRDPVLRQIVRSKKRA